MGEPHVYGWAAIVTTLTADRALSPEDKVCDSVHGQREVTRGSSAERLLEPVQKNISEILGQVAVFRGHQDADDHALHHQSHGVEKSQGEGWNSSRCSATCRASRRQKGTAVADFTVAIEFSAGGQQRRTAVADILDATKEVAHRKLVSVVRTLWRLCWGQAHRAALPCGLFETGAVR